MPLCRSLIRPRSSTNLFLWPLINNSSSSSSGNNIRNTHKHLHSILNIHSIRMCNILRIHPNHHMDR